MKKKKIAALPSIGFQILTHCDVAVILSKEVDSKGEWVHVPCLSLSFSEVQRKMQDFYFNLHGKNAEPGVNSTCHSRRFSFESDDLDLRYSLTDSTLKEDQKKIS